ncbi:MAG: glycosyltransferase [Desulfobacteraceae bacterium]|jgi:glycosyltransferase involved in cell wall biosynthesis|nr:glycosyltransferase [Desulfobacteraceae bacterium]
MKILYIVNTYTDENIPAAQPFVKAQIDSVRETGVDIKVFNVRGSDSKLNYIKGVPKIRGLIQREPFDLVHGHFSYSGWIGALQAKVPSVVSFMGSDLLGKRNDNGYLRPIGMLDTALSFLLTYFVDGIIVKSFEMARRISTKRPLMVIPNGVDFNTFKPLPKEKCKKIIGHENTCPTILFIGKKSCSNKGYVLVKEAVQMLAQELHCELLVVQEVPHHDIPLYMNASDVLILASQYEGSPNVVKEALACNLPVVATDVGDVREILKGISGCRIVHRSPKSIAKGIHAAFNAELPCNGREVIQHLQKERVAERIVHFYHTVIEKKRKSR